MGNLVPDEGILNEANNRRCKKANFNWERKENKYFEFIFLAGAVIFFHW